MRAGEEITRPERYALFETSMTADSAPAKQAKEAPPSLS